MIYIINYFIIYTIKKEFLFEKYCSQKLWDPLNYLPGPRKMLCRPCALCVYKMYGWSNVRRSWFGVLNQCHLPWPNQVKILSSKQCSKLRIQSSPVRDAKKNISGKWLIDRKIKKRKFIINENVC